MNDDTLHQGRPAGLDQPLASGTPSAKPELPPDMPPLPKAIREELELTSARPLDAQWFLGHAVLMLSKGEYAQALEQAGYAKDAAPRSATIRETLGVAAYLIGDFKRALAELQAFRRFTGAGVQDPRIADCLRATGRSLRGFEFLDEVGTAGPEATIVKAACLADTGDEAGAKAVLELGGIPGAALIPVGSLPPGSVGSTARNPRRRTGKR